ncbi:MAG TPA: response regulator [Thermodesulfobacteriota bacterium]|nr:response regulator [Thermodesulfobacteriota bacterium]
MLEAYGYEVITANDGTEALALYVQNRGNIKVVILDMMMPIMDGSATIRALQKIDPKAKIIAASGLMEKEKLAEIDHNTEVQAFLSKPYTADALLTVLHEVLHA